MQALRRLSPHAHIVHLLEVLHDAPTGRLALVFELMVSVFWCRVFVVCVCDGARDGGAGGAEARRRLSAPCRRRRSSTRLTTNKTKSKTQTD